MAQSCMMYGIRKTKLKTKLKTKEFKHMLQFKTFDDILDEIERLENKDIDLTITTFSYFCYKDRYHKHYYINAELLEHKELSLIDLVTNTTNPDVHLEKHSRYIKIRKLDYLYDIPSTKKPILIEL